MAVKHFHAHAPITNFFIQYICFRRCVGAFSKHVMHTLNDLSNVAAYRHVLILPVILACLHTRLNNRISMPAARSAPPLNT